LKSLSGWSAEGGWRAGFAVVGAADLDSVNALAGEVLEGWGRFSRWGRWSRFAASASDDGERF